MIEVVLFDCDGVLQRPARDFVDALTEVGGPAFPWAVFDAELPSLRGEVSLRSVIEKLAVGWPMDRSVEDTLSLWDDIVVDQAAWQVVADVRAAGVRAALATNQQDRRARRMRLDLGYDQRVDRSFYSCELGSCKPESAFFHSALTSLQVDAPATVFVDDSARNVEVAAELGMNVILHGPAAGAADLRQSLARFVPSIG